MHIELGNTNHPDLPPGTSTVTRIDVPTEYTAAEALLTLIHPGGVWANHSLDSAPAWVEADDAAFARRLGAYFDVPVGRPNDWKVTL
jgi:hypothetical protein